MAAAMACKTGINHFNSPSMVTWKQSYIKFNYTYQAAMMYLTRLNLQYSITWWRRSEEMNVAYKILGMNYVETW